MSPRAARLLHPLAALLALGAASCLERPAVPVTPNLQAGIRLPLTGQGIDEVDILLEIDNSNSMAGNQERLANNLEHMVELFFAVTQGAMSPIRSLRVGVITSDLGTLGVGLSSCNRSPAASRDGDNALLNPFMSGAATRIAANGQPGIVPPAGFACPDRAALPRFLAFSPTNQSHVDFVCESFLGANGCAYEQQLEAVYRALVVHGADAPAPSAAAPNGGFLRRDAILAVVMVTDEEDGSVIDCERTHPDEPCTADERARFDLIRAMPGGVYDGTSSRWASIGGRQNLNNRFYLYKTPEQDPTWPVDRYIRLGDAYARRGLLRLKPDHPERILFSAVAGVPLQRDIPTRAGSGTGPGERRIDWGRLLGTGASDPGFTAVQQGVGTQPEDGRISMRRAHVDCHCGGGAADGCAAPFVPVQGYERVYPACWSEMSARPTMRDPREPEGMSCTFTGGQAYFALPSRRIAEVARRFDELADGNGMVHSVCESSYRAVVEDIVSRIQRRAGRCLPRPVETAPAECPARSGLQGCVRTNCTVREFLPPGANPATACARPGRQPGDYDPQMARQTCIVRQVALRLGEPPPAGEEGFYYDTRPDPSSPACRQHVEFTANAHLLEGSSALLECVQANLGAAQPDAASPDVAPSDVNASQ